MSDKVGLISKDTRLFSNFFVFHIQIGFAALSVTLPWLSRRAAAKLVSLPRLVTKVVHELPLTS